MKKIKAGILGGAGYTGGELIRILLQHPQVDIVFVDSHSQAGKGLSEVHADLEGDTELKFTDLKTSPLSGSDAWLGAELLFLCMGHSESKKFLQEQAKNIDQNIRLIDLSQDFRVQEAPNRPDTNGRLFVYGLPELNKDLISRSPFVANPGCFATAILLGLLPLAKAGLLKEVFTTGITGSTGAGQALTPTSQFSWRVNNVQAYKTLRHQHLAEIHQSLHQLQKSFPLLPKDSGPSEALHFVPWRGDFARGIFISSQTSCPLGQEALMTLYQDYYQDHPFSLLSPGPIFLKQVVNTNKCVIQLEKMGPERLVIHTALDNLIKGASGQAVQNMNLMYGLDQCLGLRLKASYF
jgi:N-acetyl-gamma-glutamyl-phosphate reductase